MPVTMPALPSGLLSPSMLPTSVHCGLTKQAPRHSPHQLQQSAPPQAPWQHLTASLCMLSSVYTAMRCHGEPALVSSAVTVNGAHDLAAYYGSEKYDLNPHFTKIERVKFPRFLRHRSAGSATGLCPDRECSNLRNRRHYKTVFKMRSVVLSRLFFCVPSFFSLVSHPSICSNWLSKIHF